MNCYRLVSPGIFFEDFAFDHKTEVASLVAVATLHKRASIIHPLGSVLSGADDGKTLATMRASAKDKLKSLQNDELRESCAGEHERLDQVYNVSRVPVQRSHKHLSACSEVLRMTTTCRRRA